MYPLSLLMQYVKKPWLQNLFLIIIILIPLWIWGNSVRINNYSIFSSPYVLMAITLVLLLIFACRYLCFKPTDQISNESLDKIEPSRDFQAVMMDVVQRLKQDRYHKGKSIPWHILLGPTSAGKTTLLQQSKLHFPELLNTANVTRDGACYLNDQGVFLELDGQHIQNITPTDFWERFTRLLQRFSLSRRVQSIIIVYSITELVNQEPQSIVQQAYILQARIRELYAKMRKCIPIYIIFSHLDEIAGFQEYFSNLTEEERKQYWGFTLQPTENQLSNWEKKYQQLVETLNKRIVLAQSNAVTTHQFAAHVLGFPIQMTMLKEKLIPFISTLCAESRFHLPMFLRGLFLTSGIQSGETINLIMGRVAPHVGLANSDHNNVKKTHSAYFIHALWRNILLPESRLVNTATLYSDQKLFWLSSLNYFSYGFIIALLITWFYSYQINHRAIGQFSNAIQTYIDQNQGQNDNLVNVQQLENSNLTIQAQLAPWKNYLGFWEAKQLSGTISLYYQHQIEQIILPWLASQVADQMMQEWNNPAALYETLKVYLMLGYPQYRQSDYLQSWLQELLSKRYASLWSQGSAFSHLIALITSSSNAKTDLNSGLIKAARMKLQQVPPARLVYLLLLENPQVQHFPGINFNSQSISGYNTIFAQSTQTISVPGLYTLAGYEKFYRQQHLYLAQMEASDWVTGSLLSNNLTSEQLEEQVSELYFADYVAYWQTVMQNLQLRPVSSLASTQQLINTMIQPNSAMHEVLMLIDQNTTINNADTLTANSINKSFSELHDWLNGIQPQAVSSSQILLTLRQLNQYLNNIVESSNSNQQAYLAVKSLLSGTGASPLTQLYQQMNQTPAPLNRWLNNITKQTTNTITLSAMDYIDQVWQAAVYQPYQQSILHHYPFDPSATVAVPLTDFAHFFGPNSTIDQFVQTYLINFINTTTQPWQAQQLFGNSLPISIEALQTLQTVTQIKANLFATGGTLPQLSFAMRPINMDPNAIEAQLSLGSQNLIYKHDPQRMTTLSWPPADNNGQVTLTIINTNNQRSSFTDDGPWAFFRFLQYCHATENSNTSLLLNCHLGTNNVRYLLQSNSSSQPFTLSSMQGFNLPATLSSP